MTRFYWERHPDGPFATLIRISSNYLDPENWDLDALKRLARRVDDEMRVYKSDLREALRDPEQLPGDELFWHVEYDNGCDEAFLVWLWYQLYGDEAFEASVRTRVNALPEPFAERVDWRVRRGVSDAAAAGEWGKAVEILVTGLAKCGAPVSPAEHGQLVTLLSATGQLAAGTSSEGEALWRFTGSGIRTGRSRG